MEQTINVVLTLAFQDSTSRTYTFSGVDETATPDIKDKILAINEGMTVDFANTFVSNNGASCVMIASAKILTIREEVIYSAS